MRRRNKRMKKKCQFFSAELDGVVYRIQCTRKRFPKHLTLQIDEQTFELPWGAREEIFRLGEEQAILCVAKNGTVAIRLRDGFIPECEAFDGAQHT